MKAEQLLKFYEQGYRDFTGVDLKGADLSGAMLISVDFTGANS